MTWYDPGRLATVEEFLALEVRVGTIVSARLQRGTRKPAFTLSIDFGPLGSKTASVRIADLYEPEDLVGLQVAAVVNLPAKLVAGIASEVLVLTADNGKGENVLLIPERPVPDGGKATE
jgi:tRNA-binding protein